MAGSSRLVLVLESGACREPSKGALFMAHLRSKLGDAAFWSGLRRYTRAHAGGTVTSSDLEQAMAAASGHDLHPLFVEWVYGDGPGQGASRALP